VKALQCREFGPIESLVLADLPSPVAAADQVLIRVQAASVNFPDGLMMQGNYQIKPPRPFVGGSEVAGTIKSVGEGVKDFKPGMRVAAFCEMGGFAEETVSNVQSTFALDDKTDAAAAAAMPMTYGTSYHALLDRAKLQKGETLLVLGAGGGVGIAAVELGKLMGATVIAAASSQQKLDAARSRGADHVINYSTEDLRGRLKELLGNKGVDVVYDPVGGALTEPALRSTGWKGRYLVVGFAAGEIPRIPLNLVLLKGSALVGVFWGDFRQREAAKSDEQLAQLFRWLQEGKIRPLVGARYSLDNAKQALNDVLNRKATGKLIIEP
jgi:NADPH2:quinone reductase